MPSRGSYRALGGIQGLPYSRSFQHTSITFHTHAKYKLQIPTPQSLGPAGAEIAIG